MAIRLGSNGVSNSSNSAAKWPRRGDNISARLDGSARVDGSGAGGDGSGGGDGAGAFAELENFSMSSKSSLGE
jgi:hypothetical protein